MSPSTRKTLIISAGSVVAALAFGVGLHFLAVYLRDHGPSDSGFSLQGSGATIVFLPALIAIVGASQAKRTRGASMAGNRGNMEGEHHG
jgi:hypothetical protein